MSEERNQRAYERSLQNLERNFQAEKKRFAHNVLEWEQRYGEPIRARIKERRSRSSKRRHSSERRASKRRHEEEEKFKAFVSDVDKKLASMLARQERWKRGEYSK